MWEHTLQSDHVNRRRDLIAAVTAYQFTIGCQQELRRFQQNVGHSVLVDSLPLGAHHLSVCEKHVAVLERTLI